MVQRDVAVSLNEFGHVELQAGDVSRALTHQESLDILRKLAAQNPGDGEAHRDVAASLDSLGEVKLQAGDLAGALAVYQESLGIARKVAAQYPQAQSNVAASLDGLGGNVKLQAGDLAGALTA